MTAVEKWRMPSGRAATIDFDQDEEAIEVLRESLREAGSARMNKEVPGAGGNQPEDKNQHATTQEENQNMTETIATPRYPASDVAAALADVDTVPEGHMMTCSPDSPLFQEILATREMKKSQFPDSVSLDSAQQRFAHVVTPTGDVVYTIPDEWWAEAKERLGMRAFIWWETTPNAIIRVGEYLAISHGSYVAVTEIEVDGEPGFEFINFDEERRRRKAEESGWLDAHPEVHAAKPSWASSTELLWTHAEDGADIIYEREFGLVTLAADAHYENGDLVLGEPTARLDERESLNLEGMRALAAGLAEAIATLEAHR